MYIVHLHRVLHFYGQLTTDQDHDFVTAKIVSLVIVLILTMVLKFKHFSFGLENIYSFGLESLSPFS